MSRIASLPPSPFTPSNSRSSVRISSSSPSSPLSPQSQSPHQNTRGVRSLVQRYESVATVKPAEIAQSTTPPPTEITQSQQQYSPEHSLRPTALPRDTAKLNRLLTSPQDITKELDNIKAPVARTTAYLNDGKPPERSERSDRSSVYSNYTLPNNTAKNPSVTLSSAENDLAILRQRYHRLFGTNNKMEQPSPPVSPRVSSPTQKSPDTSSSSSRSTPTSSPFLLSPSNSTSTITTTSTSTSPSVLLSPNPTPKLFLSQTQLTQSNNSQSLTPPPSPRRSLILNPNKSASILSSSSTSSPSLLHSPPQSPQSTTTTTTTSTASSSSSTTASTTQSSTFICLICKLSKPLYLCQMCSVCNHNFCQACIKTFISHHIKTGWGLEMRCPQKSCIYTIDPLDIVRIIDEPETLELYKENMLR